MDLYSITAVNAETPLGDIMKANDGPAWHLYPPSSEPTQFVVSPGHSIFIEVRVPNEGPAFIRYYRG